MDTDLEALAWHDCLRYPGLYTIFVGLDLHWGWFLRVLKRYGRKGSIWSVLNALRWSYTVLLEEIPYLDR